MLRRRNSASSFLYLPHVLIKRAIATVEIIQDAFNIQKREKTEIFFFQSSSSRYSNHPPDQCDARETEVNKERKIAQKMRMKTCYILNYAKVFPLNFLTVMA